MPQWLATVLGGASVMAVNLLILAFFYGKFTQKVTTLNETVAKMDLSIAALTAVTQKITTLDERTLEHARRITNAETVLSGTGGHGERLTALEAWRLEHRASQ